MNKTKITYWTSTGIFSAIIIAIGIRLLFDPQMAQNFDHLEYPGYLRYILGVAKLAGVALMLVPFSGRLNEWVYAGFTINLFSASIAHFTAGDPALKILVPLILLTLMGISYLTGHNINRL